MMTKMTFDKMSFLLTDAWYKFKACDSDEFADSQTRTLLIQHCLQSAIVAREGRADHDAAANRLEDRLDDGRSNKLW